MIILFTIGCKKALIEKDLVSFNLEINNKIVLTEGDLSSSSLKATITDEPRDLNLMVLVHKHGENEIYQIRERRVRFGVDNPISESISFNLERDNYDFYAFVFSDAIELNKEFGYFYMDRLVFKKQYDVIGEFWTGKITAESNDLMGKILKLERNHSHVNVDINIHKIDDLQSHSILLRGPGLNQYSYVTGTIEKDNYVKVTKTELFGIVNSHHNFKVFSFGSDTYNLQFVEEAYKYWRCEYKYTKRNNTTTTETKKVFINRIRPNRKINLQCDFRN